MKKTKHLLIFFISVFIISLCCLEVNAEEYEHYTLTLHATTTDNTISFNQEAFKIFVINAAQMNEIKDKTREDVKSFIETNTIDAALEGHTASGQVSFNLTSDKYYVILGEPAEYDNMTYIPKPIFVYENIEKITNGENIDCYVKYDMKSNAAPTEPENNDPTETQPTIPEQNPQPTQPTQPQQPEESGDKVLGINANINSIIFILLLTGSLLTFGAIIGKKGYTNGIS